MEIIKSILSSIDDKPTFVLAMLSLCVSIISLIKSSMAQKDQLRINELDCRLKQYELDVIEKKKSEEDMIRIEARVVSLGSGKYRLKVWNSGNSTAYNVRAYFDSDIGIYIMNDEKMPYEELEAHKSFELVLVVSGASESKFTIKTEWTDADGVCHTKSQLESI